MAAKMLIVSTTESILMSTDETSLWPIIYNSSLNLSSNWIGSVGSDLDYEYPTPNDLGSRRDALYVVIPITLIYLSIFITGTIGNVSTCIVIARNKSMHTATNYYLFSLAVSDLLLLVSGLPIEVYLVWSKYPYIFGEYFCRLRGLAAECSTNASVLTITAFTAERYVAICHPFLSHTMSKLSRAIKLILGIWFVALCCAVPLAWQFGIVDLRDVNPDYVMCAFKVTLVQHSFEISTFLFFVVPMILITVLYLMIGLKLRQSNMMKSHNGQNRSYGRSTISTFGSVTSGRKNERNCRHHHTGRSSRRVLKMLVAVVVAFFLCWAPFHVQRLIAIYGTGDDRVTSKNKWIEFLNIVFTYVSGVLYYVSATINPILYNIMSNKFREAFMETLARSCGKTDYRLPQEQRSYSSLSRSQQQQRGATTGNSGSRNASGGSVLVHDNSDYSGNSLRDENVPRTSSASSSFVRHNGTVRNNYETNSSNRIDDDNNISRSVSRKIRKTNDSSVSDPTIRVQTRNGGEIEDRTKKWSQRGVSSDSNNRVNSTTRMNNCFVDRRRNCGPGDTSVARRKKFWRFFKWLPSSKAFGFSGERTGYTSPVDPMVTDIESNLEEYSMTTRGNRVAEDQRPV